MARLRSEIKPATPTSSVVLMLLAIASFVVGLWVLMALVRIVLG